MLGHSLYETIGHIESRVLLGSLALAVFYFSREYRKWEIYKRIRKDKALPYKMDEPKEQEEVKQAEKQAQARPVFKLRRNLKRVWIGFFIVLFVADTIWPDTVRGYILSAFSK